MVTVTRTRRVGGSIMVVIPKEVVREKNLKGNEIIEIKVEIPKKKKIDGFGALKGIGSWDREDDRAKDRF